MGALSALLFKYVRMNRPNGDLESEKAILVITPLISYMLTEGLGFSGVVSVLFTGVMMGRFTAKNVSVVSRQFLFHTYRVLSLVCESLAFCYIGIALPMLSTSNLSAAGWATAVVALFACLIARWVSTWACTFVVNLFRTPADRISQQVRLALWLSGLRGGVAFALSIASQEVISDSAIAKLFPPITLFIVLVTSVAISGVLPFALRNLDLVVIRDDENTDGGSRLPVLADPSSNTINTSGSKFERMPPTTECEQTSLMSQQIIVESATFGESETRVSPRIAVRNSPGRLDIATSGTVHQPEGVANADRMKIDRPGVGVGSRSSLSNVVSRLSEVTAAASTVIQSKIDFVLLRQSEAVFTDGSNDTATIDQFDATGSVALSPDNGGVTPS